MKIRKAILTLLSTVTATSFSAGRPSIRSAAVIEDASFYSRDTLLRHDSHLELAFTTAGGPVQLELQPNFDLLQHRDRASFLVEDDFGDVEHEEKIDAAAYNVYKGHALRSNGFETIKVGLARILVHSTRPLIFEGSFTIDGRMHNIQLGQVYRAMKAPGDHDLLAPDDSMVLWSDADEEYRLAKRGDDMLWYGEDLPPSCASDQMENNLHGVHALELARRQLNGDTGNSYLTQAQLASTVGQTAGCPAQREVAVLGAAADCNFCFIANQYFITGTPCGNGGYCKTGICDQGSIGHQVESWFDNNKKWLIPVVSVVGGLIVLITLYCWISSCVQKRRKSKPAPEMVYSPQTYSAPQPPQYQGWQQSPPQFDRWQNEQHGHYPQYPARAHY
ncbi:putative Disintegrin-like metalloprotease [Taphrina deformans PYCC 5710]|uniref:Disintegrin-like metalloprotease n=1 Tax=Taphrina deformans (strain PYCC 5710 / ATCC 11124 / CBS 356.35 / IMI 108563 / JCM 9778 / NBRC 8474) TaxID=1097556 RepID=R4X6T0_TAPDE|nr:putative Disintegrin-like metalloprotease [Taphrina deformans PYCC 5710]|eukprot:CCG80641.1 putative Disintegrin-like metalloprotease [Taphrina deformans PYCC 5710]